MLGRTSKLIHPLGIQIETPILVPSFSSKGFRFLESKNSTKSEVTALITTTAEVLHETALVSAFDLRYYLNSGENLSRKLKLFPDLLFVDSGGYETIEDYDISEVYRYPIKTRVWTREFHEQELNKLENLSLVIISYDNGQEKRIPLKKQVELAKKLFSKYPNQLYTFLIKPSKKADVYLNISEILEHLSLLKNFSIIGLTEKELGSSLSQRIENLRIIRTQLDKLDCKSPIHIFGNLDPLTSVLYFINGAEIFDGLTWLRYGFSEGLCVSKSNIDLLEGRINEIDGLNQNMMMFQNVIYLRRLTQEMKTFIKKHKEGNIEEAYKSLNFIGDRVKQILTTTK